jgi:Coenzyme PQQ synthesis protein D (PqqD)
MGNRWWNRRMTVDGERILDLVPRTLVGARESLADGAAQVVLLEPRFRGGPLSRWLQARLPPERAHVEVRLDAFGSTIWRLLDGRRNLAGIMCAFVAAYPDQADQASERVWIFLQELERHGFVSLQQEATPPTRIEQS